MKFAVIKTGGKQYQVKVGDRLKIEKLNQATVGETVTFSEVLLTSDGETLTLGTPLVPAAKVEAKVLAHGRAKKIQIIKFKSKTRYRKKQGHRQPFSEVEITSVPV